MKLFLLIITMTCMSITVGTSAQETKGAVIVHVANATSDLSLSQARLLYTRKVKRLWPNNKPIRPVAFKNDATLQNVFYARVLGMTREEVAAYFKQRQFANSESLPAEVAGETEMVSYVAENEGAIGFVSLSVAQANKDRVKVVSVF